jgi:hypothetical protein
MTLRMTAPSLVEKAQANAVASAGGRMLQGEFDLHLEGWRLTLRGLTLNELIRIAEAAARIMLE